MIYYIYTVRKVSLTKGKKSTVKSWKCLEADSHEQ